MNKTYQPFIIEKADKILEILKDDVTSSEYARDTLCLILTKKFIDGNLSPDDDVSMIFNSEDELLKFINLCNTHDHLIHLKDLGLVGELDDDTYFLTDKGKSYVKSMLKERKK
jgi:hypothetical protein